MRRKRVRHWIFGCFALWGVSTAALPRTLVVNQAVDFINPDIAFCGGLSSIMKIATLAALYRIPVATHNVGGILLTMASIHFGLSTQGFLISEARLGGGEDILVMAKEPPSVGGGFVRKPNAPGLGVDLDEAGVRQWQREGDPADWV